MKMSHVIVAMLCAFAGIVSAADMAAWGMFQDITFSGYAGEELADFPALVRLSAEVSAQLVEGAADLRFTDERDNELPYELDCAWAADQETLAWVRLPVLKQGIAIKAYWGNPAAEAPVYAAGAVWPSNYVGVWHLSEEGASSADSTVNALTAANHANTVLMEGKIGNARRISGGAKAGADGSYVRVPNNAALNLGSTFTVSAWVKYNVANQMTGWDRVFAKKSGYNTTDGWEATTRNDDATHLDVRGASSDSTAPYAKLNSGDWVHLALAYNGTTVKVYTNGAESASATIKAATNNQHPLTFGNNSAASEVTFKGLMDECRLSSGNLSAAWMRAEHDNVAKADFAEYSEMQSNAASAPALNRLTVSDVRAADATVSVKVVPNKLETSVYFCFGSNPENLTRTLVGEWIEVTAFETNVTALAHGQTYYFAFEAENELGTTATEVMSFITLGAPTLIEMPAKVAIVNQSIETQTELADIGGGAVTVDLLWGTDPEKMEVVNSWEGLEAPTVLTYNYEDVPLGHVYYYAFTASNVMPDDYVYLVSTATNAVSFGLSKRWIGSSANDLSWNNPANWEDGAVPSLYDTVIFDGTGFTAGQTIKYDANQTIYKLVMSTTTAFKIGSADDATAGYVLTLTEVERQDVEGTEGKHEFTGPVNIAPDANGQSIWTVNGSNMLQMNHRIGNIVPVTAVKKGGGEFQLYYAGITFPGPWSVLEGLLSVTAPNDSTGPMIRGQITIGGTDAKATFRQRKTGTVAGNNYVIALKNGYFDGENVGWNCINGITVREGGTASIEFNFYSYYMELTGGTITKGEVINGRTVTSRASAIPAFMGATMRLDSYYTPGLLVEDGAAPIDLTCVAFTQGAAGYLFEKKGAGTVRFTKENKFACQNFKISAGRVLLDNPTGSGTSNAKVALEPGTTLGGTGTVQGASATLTLNNGATASSFASLEPGTVNGETGDHIVGSLTVGNATTPSPVTFGNYSKLKIRMDKDGNCDKLMVYGDVSLAATAQLEVEFMGTSEELARFPMIRSRILEVASGAFTGDFVVSCTLPYSRVTKDESGYVFSYIPPVRLMLY